MLRYFAIMIINKQEIINQEVGGSTRAFVYIFMKFGFISVICRKVAMQCCYIVFETFGG